MTHIDADWWNLEKNCPVNVTNIVVLAQNVENTLPFRIKEEKLDKNVTSILEARGVFDTILSELLGVVQTGDILSMDKKSDWYVYKKVEDDVSRILKRLDLLEQDRVISNSGAAMTIHHLVSYKKEIEAALYGGIYYPLKNACEKEKKDKRRFSSVLFTLFRTFAGTFGGESREKKPKEKIGMEPSINYENMLSEEGQKKLENQYDKEIEGLRTKKEKKK